MFVKAVNVPRRLGYRKIVDITRGEGVWPPSVRRVHLQVIVPVPRPGLSQVSNVRRLTELAGPILSNLSAPKYTFFDKAFVGV